MSRVASRLAGLTLAATLTALASAAAAQATAAATSAEVILTNLEGGGRLGLAALGNQIAEVLLR